MLTSQDYLNKKGKGVVDEFTLTERDDEITSLEDRVKSPVDVVDSPSNDFGGDDFDGVHFRGSATEVVLDDVARASTE
ncbi:hypothetical protein K7X08_009902 [Anisodus acutangulus]|uniref:Uncharacterized protein n=1 Tax=Anisodus acutangulus TaxID=402998 RepID=A0A9Q1N4L9_9SOLA|nr:hypothetical protein K7X08_009902 [Anisodus acutangulus]